MTLAAFRFGSAVLVWLSMALTAQAQAVKLSGDDIRDLLTGNTAIGRWEGAKYRQFFLARTA